VPGYVDQAEAVRAKGVDTIACMAVNDVFVMGAWAKDLGVGEDLAMLADGNGDYTRALGLELDGTGFGLGMRGKRFAIIVDNGIAIHVAVEAPGKFEVSDVESILERL
jgi:peroxiredoxin